MGVHNPTSPAAIFATYLAHALWVMSFPLHETLRDAPLRGVLPRDEDYEEEEEYIEEEDDIEEEYNPGIWLRVNFIGNNQEETNIFDLISPVYDGKCPDTDDWYNGCVSDLRRDLTGKYPESVVTGIANFVLASLSSDPEQIRTGYKEKHGIAFTDNNTSYGFMVEFEVYPE